MIIDDEPDSAPFIVAAVAGMDGLVDISSYWVFSDGTFRINISRIVYTLPPKEKMSAVAPTKARNLVYLGKLRDEMF